MLTGSYLGPSTDLMRDNVQLVLEKPKPQLEEGSRQRAEDLTSQNASQEGTEEELCKHAE